jgi:DNA adenine methylase
MTWGTAGPAIVPASRVGAVVPITPFLRWAGSKRKLLHELQPYWKPRYKRYVEPFAGSSCLFFAIRPPSALLADKNAELIEMYEQVRRYPSDVYEGVVALARTADEYYRVRAIDPRGLPALDRAVRFIYLNRNCFNGLFRTNADGMFNVPFATSRAGKFPDKAAFREAANALGRADLIACDFGTTMRHVGAGDFVYLDPPYATSSRRVFREYGKNPFSVEDVKRLGRHLRWIRRKKAHFLLSYAQCAEVMGIAQPYHVRRKYVRRQMAGDNEVRRRYCELLISSARPPSK